MKDFANAISWIFVPLCMPLYALLVLMYVPSSEGILFNDDSLYHLPSSVKLALLFIFFVFSIMAPGLTLVYMMKKKIISNIEIDDKKERLIPLLITAGYCLILYLFFIFSAENVSYLPRYIFGLPLSGFITISLFAWINFYTKISLHACGAGILTGIIFAYCAHSISFEFKLLLIAVYISGFVLSSRLYLNKHTLPQVIYGFCGSSIIVFLINYYYPAGY
mgnify:CR=1 FL=1